MTQNNSRSAVADGLFVVTLMLYVFIGLPLTPIHADEFMQMSMARDVFYLARGNIGQIRFVPPVQPDTEQHLRLLNGPLNKDLIGFVWLLDNRSESGLPGIYAWEMPLEWNAARGNVPDDAARNLARLPSTLLTALGIAAIFLLTMRMAGRPMAYPAAILYALHPVILLNGRRAMMEGSLFLFSILAVGAAIWLSKRLMDAPQRFTLRDAAALVFVGFCAGLTLAAKHTGLIVVGAILIGLFWNLWRVRGWYVLADLGIITLVILFTFLALNPAYWNDPIGVARATLDARSELLTTQVRGDPAAYNNPLQRVTATITQPFLSAPQYYEAPTWNGVIDDSIRQYEASPVSGWRWPPLAGMLLTAATWIGAVLLGRQALFAHDPAARLLIVWWIAALASSLAVPLGWQRYYLPLLPISILLAAYVPFAIRLRVKRA